MQKQYLLEIQQKYPFGQLGQAITQQTTINVVKTLGYIHQQQYDMIKQMIHFVKSVKHEYLINLHKVEEDKDHVKLYYQYAPFRLEKWIVDVNQDLIATLQEQMIELAESLCRASIKFTFEKEAVGLSQDMNIKYFLHEFQIDPENWEHNLEEKKQQINAFFKELTGAKTETEEDPKTRMESISTNGSLTSQDQAPKLQPRQVSSKTALTSKIQDSKRRCQQVIDRFRKMNMK